LSETVRLELQGGANTSKFDCHLSKIERFVKDKILGASFFFAAAF
jgi:hypothetical protein